MFNEVVLIGRLGKEPESNETKNGTKVVTISLPLFHSYSPEGKKTEWIQCEAWGKLGNIVEMAYKGSMVAVRGELHNESWQDEGGNWRNRTYVRIDSFRFLEKKRGAATATDAAPSEEGEVKNLAISDSDEFSDIDKFLSKF